MMMLVIDCDMEYTDAAIEKTKNLPLVPYKRTVEDEELGYMKRKNRSAKIEELVVDQSDKYLY